LYCSQYTSFSFAKINKLYETAKLFNAKLTKTGQVWPFTTFGLGVSGKKRNFAAEKLIVKQKEK